MIMNIWEDVTGLPDLDSIMRDPLKISELFSPKELEYIDTWCHDIKQMEPIYIKH